MPEPNRILVRNFAVTLDEVALDRGLGPTIARDAQGEVAGDEQVKLGRSAANALAAELVAKLRTRVFPPSVPPGACRSRRRRS